MPIIIAIVSGIVAAIHFFGIIVALIVAIAGCLLLSCGWLLAALELDDACDDANKLAASCEQLMALLREEQDKTAQLHRHINDMAAEMHRRAAQPDRQSAIAQAMEEHFKTDPSPAQRP